MPGSSSKRGTGTYWFGSSRTRSWGVAAKRACCQRIQLLRSPTSPSGRRRRWPPSRPAASRNISPASPRGTDPTRWAPTGRRPSACASMPSVFSLLLLVAPLGPFYRRAPAAMETLHVCACGRTGSRTRTGALAGSKVRSHFAAQAHAGETALSALRHSRLTLPGPAEEVTPPVAPVRTPDRAPIGGPRICRLRAAQCRSGRLGNSPCAAPAPPNRRQEPVPPTTRKALTCCDALVRAGFEERPRQDSNLRTRLRRPLLYPLSYEGGPDKVSRAARAGEDAAAEPLRSRVPGSGTVGRRDPGRS